MKRLIIIGASGFGREVAWVVERINQVAPEWELIGFLDDDPQKAGLDINGYPVLGLISSAIDYSNVYFACAIGAAAIRKDVVERLRQMYNIKFATILDPSIMVSRYVSVGEGTIICAGSIITVNITIGRHVIINLGCTVGHDAHVSDYCTLHPCANVSGSVHIGECTEIGAGAQIIQGRNISPNIVIGAGAVVAKDIKVPGTYVGVPARLINKGDRE